MSARPRRRYAVIGTGGRSGMYLEALLTTHADVGEPVALVDPNPLRSNHYATVATGLGAPVPLPCYHPDDLDRMLAETGPDAVVVCSPDHTHADHVVRALDAGLDVVCEKPLTTDADGLRRIAAAAAASPAELVLTFNYRYSPRNSVLRRLVRDGEIGEVTSVHFEWCLDTVHGADYFRRWHREKARSGGLLVHKATHHFDLVNWWIDDVPATVFALGGLRFYGDANARARGLGERAELGRDMLGRGDPFVLDLSTDPQLDPLFLKAEHLDGYHRDRDVFAPGITIEDNMTVAVGYARGASLAYTLHAHCPWEGYRVAVNGTAGRVELEVVERGAISAEHVTRGSGLPVKQEVDPSAVPDAAGGGTLRPHGSRVLLQRHWEPAVEVAVPWGAGSHGGGDAMLLDDVFRGPGDDPLGRRAGWRDGVRSVVVGVAANESLRTGEAVDVARYGLPVARGAAG